MREAHIHRQPTREAAGVHLIAPWYSALHNTKLHIQEQRGRRAAIILNNNFKAEIPLISSGDGLEELRQSGRWLELAIPLDHDEQEAAAAAEQRRIHDEQEAAAVALQCKFVVGQNVYVEANTHAGIPPERVRVRVRVRVTAVPP